MRQIYRIMSDMLVPGLVCAILFAIIGGISLLPRFGEYMKIPEEDYSSYQDVQQSKVICHREPPNIIRRGPGNWQPGKEISVEQVFQGRDEAGQYTQIQVVGIQDEQGNSRMDCYDREEHTLLFPSEGAYLLKLQSMDQERKIVRKRFILLVDHR